MVQVEVGLLHLREQGFAQRLSPVCQRWYPRSNDGVVKTHSIKYNAQGPFLNAFELVCLSYCQTGMPHMAGVFVDRTDDCGIIYFDEMMRFYSSTLE